MNDHRGTWLVVAEADKIQDVVFGSATLAQVVGGSAMLARFCGSEAEELVRRAADALGLASHAIEFVVMEGGVFRFLVPDATRVQAAALGERLANVYAAHTGGTISVAPPEQVAVVHGSVRAGQFDDASGRAAVALREVKRSGAPRAVALLPPAAICEDCGRAPATELRAHQTDARPRYRCDPCCRKREVRDGLRYRRDRPDELFLSPLLEALTDLRPPLPEGATEDEREADRTADDMLYALRPPPDLHVLAEMDQRGQVAFLVADGNAMGAFFNQPGRPTGPTVTRHRSELLTRAIQHAAAALIDGLLGVTPRRRDTDLPCIPLILAGDDAFLALPAGHAVAAICRFAEAFEWAMAQADADQIRQQAPTWRPLGVPNKDAVTTAVGLVIASPGLPYTTAHRHAEARLKEAKQLSRRLLSQEAPVSALAFVRSAGTEPEPERTRRFLSTDQPYLTGGYARGQAATVGPYARHTDDLFGAAENLRLLPAGRRQDLRELFDAPVLAGARSEADLAAWNRARDLLLARIDRRPAEGAVARWLVRELGDPTNDAVGYWRRRPERDEMLPSSEPRHWYHALPDVIEALPALGRQKGGDGGAVDHAGEAGQ